jgi:hypothetical protein
MITPRTKHESKSGDTKTYLGEITIKRWRSELLVTPTNITFTGETVHWMNGKKCFNAIEELLNVCVCVCVCVRVCACMYVRVRCACVNVLMYVCVCVSKRTCIRAGKAVKCHQQHIVLLMIYIIFEIVSKRSKIR